MTKITKRIWLAICSCVFAVCLAFTGWIFADTHKTMKAAAASDPTVTFKGINENQNNADWETSPGFGFTAAYLIFEGADFTANNSNGVEGITYTVPGGVATTFGFTWVAEADLRTLILLNQNITIPDGSVLNIAAGTEYAGQVLPEVSLVMQGGKWVDSNAGAEPEPPVVEPTVTFEGFGRNNAESGLAPAFNSLELKFSKAFTDGQLADYGLTDKVYYTKPDGTKVQYQYIAHGSFWKSNDTHVLSLLTSSDAVIETGSVLTVVEGTKVGGQVLPAVTLYMNADGKWQTEFCATVTFEGFGRNNTESGLGAAFNSLELKFSKAFTDGQLADYGLTDKVYYTTPDGTKVQYQYIAHGSYWGSNDTQVLSLLTSSSTVIEKGSVLTVVEGTSVGGQVLPAVTLYMNADGKWQTDALDFRVDNFTTEVGGSIRVSSDGHNGLRFESHIGYAEYNALVEKYGEANVELGTYILPKHYLEAYGGDLYSYVTTQTDGVHFNKISTWDEDKGQNGFINRATAATDGYYKYYGSITNIQLHNYTTEFIGVGYLKIGGDLYLTHDGSWSRNVYYIAEKAYTDTNDDGTWVMADSSKLALLEYLKNVVSIHSEGSELVDNLDTLLEIRSAEVTKGYTLDLNAETGVITITSGEKGLGGVVIDGQNFGALAANTTKYANYYSANRELVDRAEEVGVIHFGIIEPTQELWGEGGSDLWSADKSTNDGNVDKTSTDWATAFLHDKSNAANIAKVTSAMGGDTARIWMNTLDFVWGSPSEAKGNWNSIADLQNGMNPGAVAVLQKVINDTYANGATNISILSGVADLSTTRNFYNSTTKKWYNRWGNDEDGKDNGGQGKNDGHVAGLIVLPNESDYEQFLLLQREYFKQLALVCGDKVTAIEVLNEIDNNTASFRCCVEGNPPADFAALKAQAVMDICRMATLGVQDAGKNIKIAMPALTCVGGSAEFFTAQYTSIKGTRINDNLSTDTQALFATTDADDYFQIINIHPYVFLSSETSSTNYLYFGSGSSRTAESYDSIKARWTEYVGSLRTIAVNNGDEEKPFWITELGIADYKACGNSSDLKTTDWSDYWNNTVARQARVFQAVFDAIETLPYIDTVMAFRVGDYEHTGANHDYAQCGEASYGMITTSGTLKDIGKYLYAIVNGQNIWSGTVGNSSLIATSSITGITDVMNKVEGIY